MGRGSDRRGESALRSFARALAPRPRADGASYSTPPRRLLVLVKGENPTFSYYLENRLRLPESLPWMVRSIDTDPLDDIDPDGLLVLVCRYIGRRQLRWLEVHRESLAGVALFIDDDIAALVAGRDGSLAYRAYLAYFGLLPLRRLNRLLSGVWVSTPPLQRRLGGKRRKVDLLAPSPILADQLPLPGQRRSGAVSLAFHATDIHDREHAFLAPIVKEVLMRRPDLSFEVLARGGNRRLWQTAGIDPRQLSLLPLVPWPDYYAQTRQRGADILLVPLLDGLANEVRADTKRIDCCRMGAAAIFSRCEIYERRRKPSEAHVETDGRQWVETILRLADDGAARSTAAAATRESVADMAREAMLGYEYFSHPAASAGAGR